MKVDFKRVGLVMLGFCILSFGIAAMRALGLGVDPFASFVIGVSHYLRLSFAITLVLMHLPFFILMCIKDRRLIGIGTLLGMTTVGFMVDFFYWMFGFVPVIDAGNHMAINIVWLLPALVIFAFGIATYLVADIGVVPYDSIGLVAEKLSKGKLKFKWVRVGADATCTVIGLTLGLMASITTVGVATVITAVVLGPLISFFRGMISKRVKL